MTITPAELLKRLQHHGEIITEETDEKIKKLENENAELKKEVKDLKNKVESSSSGGNGGITLEELQKIFGKENFDENGKYKGGVKTVYKLNEPKNNGLEPQELTDALEKLKEENQWKPKEYKPLTVDILNKLLEDFFDKDAQKENLDGWLKGLGGYTLDKEQARKIKVAEVKEVNDREEFTGKRIEIEIDGKKVTEQEGKWSDAKRLDLTGTYLLPFVYSLINYDPDVAGADIYAKLDENGEIDKSGNGVLPILTGGGKTTKTVSCLVRGKKNNVVLVCPNEALAADAEVHHKTWLQKDKYDNAYKCVIHGKHHGGYNVVKDDLIYYEDRTDPNNIQKKGEYGLSILQSEKLLGYIVRSAVKPEDLKEPTGKKLDELKKTGQFNENFAENVAKMKEKVINKENTIIVFDEAHFSDSKYQELQKRLVKMNYKVIIMSATFPRKRFSITMSHSRDVWLVPKFEPEYLEDGETEKWSVEKTQIFLRTTEDEFEISPTTGKKGTQLLWSGLTAKQKKLLDDNNIAYICFDRTNQGAVTAITEGMPAGSIFFANPDHEMGFTPYVNNVICTGQAQLISLGKTGTPWIYDTPEKISLFLASLIQQIGRVARLFKGVAYLLNKDLYDVDPVTGKIKILKPPKDLSYKFVTAALSGTKADLEVLIKQGANMGSDPNFLRAALGLTYKFGLKPEEILVGVGGIKPIYPVFKVRPTPPVVDEELWNRHLGNPTPPKIDKASSKQTMLIIIMDYFKKESDITTKIDVSFSNSLIKNAWGKEVEEEGKTEIVIGEEEKKEAVEEIKQVLHTVFDEYRKGLAGYKEGKIEYSESEKGTFDKLVSLYKVVNGVGIKVGEDLDNGKMKTVIEINYPVTKKGRQALILEEEIDTWRCHRCLKTNNGYRFCEGCGIDVRLNEERQEKNELVQELEAKIEIPHKS